MKNSPIIIVGFGRSGTTWLSDIISKILGGIILFEPFHPKVFTNSESYCYSQISNKKEVTNHIFECKSYTSKSRWLYRNHINRADGADSSFIKYVSNHTNVIGFKTIRSNHMISFLSTIFNSHTILIHRHPFAVLTSIMNRPQFWNEFGWDWHCSKFFERSLIEEHFTSDKISVLEKVKDSCVSKKEVIILMWSISFIISSKDIRKIKGFSQSYEALYLDPFNEIKKILSYLDKKSSKIHPSHIFTPSLTTLKTIHAFNDFDGLSNEKLDDIFWKDYLSKNDQEILNRILDRVLILETHAYERAVECGYIK